MPRDLPLGNGELQINFDAHHHLVDLYYPYVGGENHALGHPFRVGVWVDGRFAWLSDDGWRGTQQYLPETLVTDVTLEHPGCGVRLHMQECVDFHVNAFVRRIEVGNLAPGPREIRLFFHQDFHISGVEYGDTAYYDPQSHGLFHYKGHRWFHANILTPSGMGWTQYAAGIKEWEGREGTWRDAEDGMLSGNPIAQGSVDSTGGVALTVPGGGEQTVFYWLLAGETYEDLRRRNLSVQRRGPDTLLRRTRDYWRLWVNKETMDFGPLPAEITREFKLSLLILRTQIGNRGEIVASTDADILRFGRDTYGYVWPRDGAMVARALGMAGYNDLTRSFFEFCGSVTTREGFLLQKYNPDRSVGSSWHPWAVDGVRRFPIQEDETGLVLWALYLHFVINRDVEFIKPLYRPLITKAADFLAAYRDPATGLPLPSYDLWEERYGVHTFTCSAVFGGLEAAAAFAQAFGETDRAGRYRMAADQIREGMLRYLWSEKAGRFGRTLGAGDGGGAALDLTIDASLLALNLFGMFGEDDPKTAATVQAVEKRLWVQTPIGGLARFENDAYMQVSHEVDRIPGNPWIICTLWLAELYIRRAKSQADFTRPLELLRWAVDRALPSGVLAEQVHPLNGNPLSVSPLTWSHAQFVHAVLHYLNRLHALDLCPHCGQATYHLQESNLIRAQAAQLGIRGDPLAVSRERA